MGWNTPGVAVGEVALVPDSAFAAQSVLHPTLHVLSQNHNHNPFKLPEIDADGFTLRAREILVRIRLKEIPPGDASGRRGAGLLGLFVHRCRLFQVLSLAVLVLFSTTDPGGSEA